MKKALSILAALAAGLLPAALWAAGSRVGGNADILYEAVGAGGASFASSGNVKLGGTLGQGGLALLATNDQAQVFLNGFWKSEDSCTLYNPTITQLIQSTGTVAITFMVVNGNTYSVEYVTHEEGGLMLGSHAITNPVTTVAGVGLAGSTTTIWHNVSASTNRVRFYVIRCE